MIQGIVMTAVLLSLTVAPADVSGTWQVTMEGEKRPIEGTLVLQQKGGQLTGTWTSIEAWTMTGRADETGRFALESETRPVPMTVNGKKGTIKARWVFRGVLGDGALSGTASIEFGDSEPRIRKWTAKK